MNLRYGLAVLVLLTAPMLAHASCDAVKSSIDAKLQAKHLSGYTLDVVASDQQASGGKVVGHCEGDKSIVYTKGAASSEGEATAPAHHHKMKPAMKPAADEHEKSDEPKPAASSSSGG